MASYHPQLGVTPGLFSFIILRRKKIEKDCCFHIIDYLIISLFTCLCTGISCINIEQQLENLTDVDQAETEDDLILQQWEQFRRNPINLNTADANDLRELRILTGSADCKSYFIQQILGNL